MTSNSGKALPFFVLVLGPHRSGSSVTTKILQSLGCNLGSDLLGAEPSNAIGHFENLEVLDYNEDFLRKLETDWKNPEPLAHSSYYDANKVNIQKEICSLLQKILDKNINAIKDPRVPILLDAWNDAISRTIPKLKIIVTIRHPAEVAASLEKRDNLSHVIGVQLWAQATLNALKFARNYSNHFVFYDRLINEPQDVTKEISEYLHEAHQPENLSALAAKDVVTEYRHNKVADGESAVLNVAVEMYEQISRFNTATSLNFPDEILDAWQARIQSINREVNRLELIRVTDSQRDRIITTLTSERDQIAAERDRIIQGLTSELVQNTNERDQIAIQRDQIAIERDRITLHLTSERDQIAADRDRITQILTSKRDQIAADRDQIASERNLIASERDQIKNDRDLIARKLTSERDQIAGERDRIAGERDEIAADRDQLNVELNQLTSERDQLLNSTIWRATKPIRWFVNLFKS